MKSLKRMVLLSTIIILCALFYSFGAAKEPKIKTEYLIKPDRTEYVYMICNVSVDLPDFEETDIVLPNGEVHAFDRPEDAPESFSEVVIKAADVNSVETYEIVGLR